MAFKKSDTVAQDESKSVITDAPDLKGLKILLVEDMEFNIMVAEKMLQNWNAVVEIAGNGKIALDKVRETNYDIILMDLQMPVIDGYTATRAIREFNTTTPVIALTASITIDIQGKASEFGMNDCITKPFNPRDLYSIIKKYSNQ